MKRLIILCVFVIGFNLNCNSQDLKSNYDVEYFILGSLSDYFGWKFHVEEDELIGFYHNHSFYELFRIDSLLKENNSSNLKMIDYSILADTFRISKTSKRYCLCSKQLFSEFKKFYTFPIYLMKYQSNLKYKYGKLKYTRLESKSNLQLNSFLAGAFSNFGTIEQESYQFNLANSRNKAKVIYKLLKKLDCKNVEYVKIKGEIGRPSINIVSFIPSIELEAVFIFEFNKRITMSKQDYEHYFKRFDNIIYSR